MSGVSIGYFDPSAVVLDVPFFCNSVAKTIGPAKLAWPLEVRTIAGAPLAYAKVDGFIPLHIDPEEEDEAGRSSPRMFHFVFRAENRPLLLMGAARTPPAPDSVEPLDEHDIHAIQRSRCLLTGPDPRSLNTFLMGAIELTAGMAVHFDISTHWHGISSAPVPMRALGVRQDPKLIIIQMCGYDANEIERAVADMTALLQLDGPYWRSGRRDRAGKGRR